uniref:Uncharacterized protein n=1 Tax=Castor canadensis TaxID=51338 RepID=A0A8C0WAC9_CASCN
MLGHKQYRCLICLGDLADFFVHGLSSVASCALKVMNSVLFFYFLTNPTALYCFLLINQMLSLFIPEHLPTENCCLFFCL